jgi:hypothetical protein
MKMKHFLAALMLVPSLALTGSAQAIGSYQRPAPITVTPSMVRSVPEHAAPPGVSAGQILARCGGGRFRDPDTHSAAARPISAN